MLISRPSLILLLFALAFFSSGAKALSCKDNVGVVPPAVSDQAYADRLIEATRPAALARYKIACAVFLPPAENKKAFGTLGISSYHSLPAERLLPEALTYLVQKTTLTHIVFLSLNAQLQLMQAALYRLESNEGGVKLQLIDTFPIPQQDRSSSWIEANMWRLRPNAFTSLAPSRSLMYKARDASRTEILKLGPSPSVLGGFSFSNVEHPAAVGRYAYSFGLSPMATGYFFQQNFYRDFETLFRKKVGRLDMSIGCSGASVDGTFHSPLGASYLSFSLAPCLMHGRRSSVDPKTWELSALARVIAGHRTFIYKNDFIFYEWARVRFASTFYEARDGTIDSFDEWAFGAGVFIP